MTENPKKAVKVNSLQLQEQLQNKHESMPELSVKQERIDAEVEAKLKALNAKIKAEDATPSDASPSSSSEAEEKKDIAPVKSSNEILAELFSVFNAAPPEELLDEKKRLKKAQKKIKKDKKKKTRSKHSKLEGECSDSDVSVNGKHRHKHKRKKHKHKHKESRDKNKDKDREKSKEHTVRTEEKPFKEKDKSKSRERDRKRHRSETPNVSVPEKRSRTEERERAHNSFYNGFRERTQAKDERGPSRATKSKADHHDSQKMSDVSLSDEETYLREKADEQRRPFNSFYGDSSHARIKEEPSDNKRYISRRRQRSNSRNRERSRSRSRDLGIDKKRLLEVARKNAISMFKRGTIPGVANMSQEIKDKVLLKMRYGGRTVQDLTEFCKKISNGNVLSELSSEEDSDVDKNGNAKAFHHPFQIQEREPIVMHIRNSTPIVPVVRKEEQTKAITMQFPVSSGQVHRMSEKWVPVDRKDAPAPLPALPPAKQSTNMFKEKEIQKNVFAQPLPHHEQQEPAFKPAFAEQSVPSVATNGEPTTIVAPVPTPVFVPEVPIPSATSSAPVQVVTSAPTGESIFPEPMTPGVDVSSIITQRLSAIRRLQDNPTDSEALKMMYNAQRDMSSWASSKHLPGQFTGSTGANVMKVHELNSGPQLWVRRDQLTSTKPVTGGMGMTLLQKMGWKPGEGLGRTKTGSLQPLLLDVKLDKRGLVSREDINYQAPRPPVGAQRKAKQNSTTPAPLNAQDKHPVCILNELTSKNKWTPPQYKLLGDSGPAHMRTFLFSVEINGLTYTPPQASNTKKEAKLNAAKLCLQALGILPNS